ncbi:pheromone A receptor-domain-containing protein [Schizophyllum amplum]|uniref:Pheromone A receptor-domain-containing protein n=1 Tax=Schizophyllum amplum TaxID=97359 RepID=A0A550C0I8_9AGAR|nr:pheromone A receptor-domain-containing protein [Auriculariopsis ampla]
MRAELPVLSIVSVCIITVALPFKRVWRDIPTPCLLLWLLAWNLIHTVNAVMWAGNAGVRTLVWCDLATKVALAALMGVAGCALCMLRVLEFLATARKPGPNTRRNTVAIEILFCVVIPLVYIILHFIVQDRRFNVVADIGCVASVHPSSLSLILMWLPPSLICVAAFAFSCIAVHHATRLPSTLLDEHLSTRTSVSSGLLLRHLCFASTTCSLIVIAVLFAVFSPTIVPWGSWGAVHAHMSEVEVVSGSEGQAAEVMFWIAPIVTILWLLCFVLMGSERKQVLASIQGHCSRFFWRSRPPPVRSDSTMSFFDATERPTLKAKCSGLGCSVKSMFSKSERPPKQPKVKLPRTLSMMCEDIVGLPFSDREAPRTQPPTTTDPSPVPSSRFSVATTAVGSEGTAPSGWKKLKDSLSFPEQRPRAPAIVVPLSIRTGDDVRNSAPLRSGWDDMLDRGRKPPVWNLKRIVTPSKRVSATVSSSSQSSSDDSDAAFRENTLAYMESPVARTLGLTSPTAALMSPTFVSPPPAYASPPRRGVLGRPPSCTPPRPPSVPLSFAPQRLSGITDMDEGPSREQSDPQVILMRDPPMSQSIPEDAKSTISSICRGPWPEPPCSPPPLPFSSMPVPLSPASSQHSRNSSNVFGTSHAPGLGRAF